MGEASLLWNKEEMQWNGDQHRGAQERPAEGESTRETAISKRKSS